MRFILGILLAVLTVEGLILLIWPTHVRAIIHETSEGVLRIAGVIEIIIALILVVVVLKLL